MAMAKLLFIFTLLFLHLIGRSLDADFIYLPMTLTFIKRMLSLHFSNVVIRK